MASFWKLTPDIAHTSAMVVKSPEAPPRPKHIARLEPVIGTKPVNLILNDAAPMQERILDLNVFQRVGISIKSTFVDTPRAIYRGLVGHPDHSFDDFMRTGRIPYFMGGLLLTVIAAAGGGNKFLPYRMGAGVVLYYLGQSLAKAFINGVVRLNDGLNLNQKFLKNDGTVQNVFTSATFSRYDLMKPHHHELLRKRMGIPETIADPEGEVEARIKTIIPAARIAKTMLANVAAAIGAGYLSRTDRWGASLMGLGQSFKDSVGRYHYRAAFTDVWDRLSEPIRHQIKGTSGDVSPQLRFWVLGILGLTTLYSTWQVLAPSWKKRDYEDPGIPHNNLTPESEASETSKAPAAETLKIEPKPPAEKPMAPAPLTNEKTMPSVPVFVSPTSQPYSVIHLQPQGQRPSQNTSQYLPQYFWPAPVNNLSKPTLPPSSPLSPISIRQAVTPQPTKPKQSQPPMIRGRTVS